MPRKPNKTGFTKEKLTEELVKIFRNNHAQLYNYKQLSKLIGVQDFGTKQIINKVLAQLNNEKIILQEFPGKYRFNYKKGDSQNPSASYITGIVDMAASGAAYIVSPDQNEDVKVAANRLNRAMHGDTVKVFLYAKRSDRKPEGEVVEIITRAKNKFVGTVQLSGRIAFLIPDNNIGPDIFIPLNSLNGAKNKQKAIAIITEWPEEVKNPVGEIVQVLGNPGDNDVEMNSILVEYGLPIAFPPNVEEAANQIPMAIPAKEYEKRRDFRKITTITIDPIDAKDFDDALSIKKLDNGNYEIGVHIADVSHFVRPNTLLDEEAYNRGTSIYLVDRVVPMLPEHLSNGVCSLRPDEDKLCFAAVFELDSEATIKNEWFGKTIIRSNRRFHYEEVQTIIETETGDFAEDLLVMHKLASKLREKRFKSGSIGFERAEVKFNLDEKGFPTGVYFKIQKDSNKLIEDFMLLANRKVAELFSKNKKDAGNKAFVYRIHDKPNPEKLQEFSEVVKKLGYKLNTLSRKSTVDSMNKLMQDVVGKGEQNMVETLAIRTMAKAVYSSKNVGHYGLAFKDYTHFTSPIRRYPDLMVHRELQEILTNQKQAVASDRLEEMCKHTSQMEQKSAEAERASVKYKQVQYLADKIGKEFIGNISGVTKWGIFVEIVENKCEGLVRLSEIEDDFYHFDEENFSIIGTRHGKIYRLGDTVNIRVIKADMVKKQLDFKLVRARDL